MLQKNSNRKKKVFFKVKQNLLQCQVFSMQKRLQQDFARQVDSYKELVK